MDFTAKELIARHSKGESWREILQPGVAVPECAFEILSMNYTKREKETEYKIKMTCCDYETTCKLITLTQRIRRGNISCRKCYDKRMAAIGGVRYQEKKRKKKEAFTHADAFALMNKGIKHVPS